MIMPGVPYIIDYFLKKECTIGIATSSPQILADAVIAVLGIEKVVSAVSTAEHLDYGKPTPAGVSELCRCLNGPAAGMSLF